jgi:hypothetical protein
MKNKTRNKSKRSNNISKRSNNIRKRSNKSERSNIRKHTKNNKSKRSNKSKRKNNKSKRSNKRTRSNNKQEGGVGLLTVGLISSLVSVLTGAVAVWLYGNKKTNGVDGVGTVMADTIDEVPAIVAPAPQAPAPPAEVPAVVEQKPEASAPPIDEVQAIVVAKDVNI